MKLGHAPALAWSIAGFLLALPQMAWAGDEIRASGDVDVTGGYSNNPFSEAIGDPGSAYVEIRATPKLRLISEDSVLSLDGVVDYEHYFRLYSDKSDYKGALDYLLTPNSRLTMHANVYYDSSIVGGLESNAPADLSQPQTTPTTGTDLALFGSQPRRNLYNGAGDVTYNLSALSTLTANAFYNAVRYGDGFTQSDYDGYGGGAGYSRQFSQHLHLGVQGSVARYVYRGLLGHSQVYTLQATFNDAINDRWSVSGAIGGTRSERTIGGNSTYVTGNVLLCRITTRTNLCLTAAQAVLPTGSTGTIDTRTAGGSYSYQLSEHSKFSLAANYSHNDSPQFLAASTGSGSGTGVTSPGMPTVTSTEIPFLATSYITSTATFDRTLKERIHFLASLRYRKLMGGIGNRPDDYGGSVGILVKFGDYR